MTHRQLLRLVVDVTSRPDGFRPEGEPVGCEGSDGTHPHEGVRGQPADVLPQLVQLGNPQLSQDFLSLHDCCSLVTLPRETRGIITERLLRGNRRRNIVADRQTDVV